MASALTKTNPFRRHLLRAADPSGARRCLSAAAELFGSPNPYCLRWDQLTPERVKSLLQNAERLPITTADRAELLEHIKGVVTQGVQTGALRPDKAAAILLISSADCPKTVSPARKSSQPSSALPAGTASRLIKPRPLLNPPGAPVPLRGKDRSVLEPLAELFGGGENGFPWHRLTADTLKESLDILSSRGADRLLLSRILSALDRLGPSAATAGLLSAKEAERLFAVTLQPENTTHEYRQRALKSAFEALRRTGIPQEKITALQAADYDADEGTVTFCIDRNAQSTTKLSKEARRRLQHWLDWWLADKGGPLFPECRPGR
ncbi:MAG: hypothetical protein ACI4SY_06195 [Sutterella sp.]